MRDLEPHLLEMAIAIEARRRVRDYGHPLEKAMAETREAAAGWADADADCREYLAFNLAVAQARACWAAVQNGTSAVARLAERDAMAYVIRMEPGRKITMRSLGLQFVALQRLLAASAKEIGGAALTCFVNDLRYDKQANEITIQIGLLHTMPGVVPSDQSCIKAPLPDWLGPDTPEQRAKLQEFVKTLAVKEADDAA